MFAGQKMKDIDLEQLISSKKSMTKRSCLFVGSVWWTSGARLAGLTGPPDLILSDMAANTTGHKSTDHLRTVALVELALDFAIAHLAPGGAFISKVFQGGATRDVLERLKSHFSEVKHIKPPASRVGSPEIFVVAKGFKGAPS